MSGRESREGNQVRPLVTSMDSDHGPLDCNMAKMTTGQTYLLRGSGYLVTGDM